MQEMNGRVGDWRSYFIPAGKLRRMQLDHVGIATTQGERLASVLTEILDAPVVHEEESSDISFRFLDVEAGYLELLEPKNPASDIGEYIADQGEGVHHLGFEALDLDAALDAVQAAGVDLLDDEPRPGAWGHRIAFLDPASTGSVLIELFDYGNDA